MKDCIKCEKKPFTKMKEKEGKTIFKIYCSDCGRHAKGVTAEEAEAA